MAEFTCYKQSILTDLEVTIRSWRGDDGWTPEVVRKSVHVLKIKLITGDGQYVNIDILPSFDNLRVNGGMRIQSVSLLHAYCLIIARNIRQKYGSVVCMHCL